MSSTKEETAYTPGPWETDEHGCMVFIPVRNESLDGKPRFAVATATDELRPVAGFYSPFDELKPGEAKANMQLIAAAPELLVACEYALAVIEGIAGGDHFKPSELAEAQTDISTAINRALGKS